MPNNSFLSLSFSSAFLFDHFIGSKFRININAAAAEFISLLAGDRRFCNFFAGVSQNEDPLKFVQQVLFLLNLLDGQSGQLGLRTIKICLASLISLKSAWQPVWTVRVQDHFNPPHPDPGRREKINLNFYFNTSLWCLKGFMKGFMAFIKPFETPQRNVKIKI